MASTSTQQVSFGSNWLLRHHLSRLREPPPEAPPPPPPGNTPLQRPGSTPPPIPAIRHSLRGPKSSSTHHRPAPPPPPLDPLHGPPTCVKLSPCGLIARSLSPTPTTVHSTFQVSTGVYFYEATLETSGSLRLGWACRESRLLEEGHTPSDGLLLGDDACSVAYNGASRSIHQGADLPVIHCQATRAWKSGDTVGCLLDLPRAKVHFYLNGVPIYAPIDVSFLTSPSASATSSAQVYACASLTRNTQIHFNFGQLPFRHPPPPGGADYRTFHGESHGNGRAYRLAQPSLVSISRQFTHFSDQIQTELDLVVSRWLTKRTSCLLLPELLLNPEFIKYEQGILRLSQSMLNLVTLENPLIKEDLYYYYDKLFTVYFIESNLSKMNILAKFLTMIGPILSGPCLADYHWTIHRNLCLILLILLEHCKYTMKQEASETILRYLLRILAESGHGETILYALVGVELRLVNIIHFNLPKKMSEQIMDLLSNLATESELTAKQARPDLIPEIQNRGIENIPDSYRYQIAFISRWMLEHIFVSSSLLTSMAPVLGLPPVQLSEDRLSARCESSNLYAFVRSGTSFVDGSWFYEVTLLTGGLMRIGWASKASRLEEYKKLGDDRSSVAFNGYDRWVWHGKPVALKNIPRWQAGDVLGVALDTDAQQVTWYLNGYEIATQKPDFGRDAFTPPYFAAAYLFPHQQLVFNFGQEAFRFPPPAAKNLVPEYSTFHQVTNGNRERYRLSVLSTRDELWHHFQASTQVQGVFDEWLLELQNRVSSGFYEEEYFNVHLLESFARLMEVENGRLRLYHSIIRILEVGVANLDILVGWIETYSAPKSAGAFWASSELVALVGAFVEVPMMAGGGDDAHHGAHRRRSVALVLYLMVQTSLQYLDVAPIDPEDFYLETSYFLASTLLDPEADQWASLFALQTLQIFATFDANRIKIQAHAQLHDQLIELAKNCQFTTTHALYDCKADDYLAYQVGYVAGRLLERLASEPSGFPNLTPDSSQTTFHCLPSGCYTARGDSLGGCSHFRSPFTFLSGAFYYEAILLTGGSMKLGWAVKEVKGEGEKFTYALDLYLKVLWTGGAQVHLRGAPTWKAGDVVGCLIDLKKGKPATFTLNGAKIDCGGGGGSRGPRGPESTRSESTFYAKPYFAAVSLASHQQVAFNWGQAPFAHPPGKAVKYGTFSTAVKIVGTG